MVKYDFSSSAVVVYSAKKKLARRQEIISLRDIIKVEEHNSSQKCNKLAASHAKLAALRVNDIPVLMCRQRPFIPLNNKLASSKLR